MKLGLATCGKFGGVAVPVIPTAGRGLSKRRMEKIT
jgi:hypothetical protein